MTKKLVRINPDWNDRTADWIKFANPKFTEQDRRASAEAVRRLKQRRKDDDGLR